MAVPEEFHESRPPRVPRGRGWDVGLDVLAYTAMLGAGAWAGLKYFPSFTVRRAADKWFRRNLPIGHFGNRLQRLQGRFSKVFDRPTHIGPQWKWGQRPQDLTLLHELEVATETFRANSGIAGANIDDVTRSLLSRHATDVPQAHGSRTPLTVSDFLQGTGYEKLAKHVGEDSAGKLRDRLDQLSRLPGFRQSLSRLGKTWDQFIEKTPVGAFMVNTPEGVFQNRAGLRALFEDVSNIRFPFTQFKPFGLLIPDLSPKPGMTFLGPNAAKAMFGHMHLGEDGVTKVQDALFASGTTYPLVTQPRGDMYLDRGVAGFRLASTRMEGAARAAAARMDILIPSKLEKSTIPREQEWLRKQVARARRVEHSLHKRGVGPRWAGRRSIFQNIAERLNAIAQGRAPVRLETTGTPAAGMTPEGSMLRSLFNRPVGTPTTVSDLSWGERVRLAIGGIIRRPYKTASGRFQSQPVFSLEGLKGSTKKMRQPFGMARRGGGYIRGVSDPIPVEFYATRGGQGISDWLNYQISRPLWLMSEATGLGVKQAGTPLGTIGQVGLKVALPAYMGYQALDYMEYKTSRWFGFGPVTGAAALYTQMRVESQHILDQFGITRALQGMEERYPGLVESPVSKGVRAAATALGGTYVARGLASPYAKMASVAAGLTASWLQVAGISKPADELTRIYSGEQDVPVRSSRWWSLGRLPFGGGKIKYFQPSWYHRLKTRGKDIGTYGSRQEAWRGSYLPTPENWFLLKNLYDPYYLERQHYNRRPYPDTAGLFGDVPLAGPILERTVGRIIKPVQRREIPVGAQSSTPSYPAHAQAISLGYGPPIERQSLQGRRLDMMTGETLYRLFDWTGLPGFMVGALKEQLTGTSGFYLDRKALATSKAMSSAKRDYYDRNLGGLLGMTEFVRRFLPNDKQYQYFNPIPNNMQAWLPGKKSVFSADRENYRDLHHGDPFTALEKGEMRLPGAGWEATRRGVNGGTPGMYTPLDKFQILADVAPHSQAYKSMRKVVHGQIAVGTLAQTDAKRFAQIQRQVADRDKSRVAATGFRYGDDDFRSQEVTIADTGLTTFTTWEHPGMEFHLAGVETMPYALEGAADKYGKLKRKMAEMRGKKVAITYGGFGPTTPAIMGDMNAWAMDAGMGKHKPVDDLDYRAKHGTSVTQQVYENLIHTNLPGPMGYPRTKWFGQMAPIEEYESFVRSGVWNTGWEQPYENYIKPWFNQSLGTVSSSQLEARRINEYMDHLKFVKNRQLEERAMAMGDMGAANIFHRRSQQTMVGADPMSDDFYSNIFGALPPSERPYFSAFAGVTSEAQQERILKAVPENMAPIYVGVWSRMTGTSGFRSPVMQRYSQQFQRELTDSGPEQRVAEYFANQPLPEPTYAGWHPSVSQDTLRVKMAQHEGLDVHHLGMWPQQEARAEELPTVGAPVTHGAPMDQDQLLQILRQQGLQNIHMMPGMPGSGSRMTFNRSRTAHWKRAYFDAYMQGAI